MQFTRVFVALAFASSAIATYAAVKSDVDAIAKASQELNDAAQKIDGTNLLAALGVQSKFTDLLNVVKKTASDAKALKKKLGVPHGKAILSVLSKNEATIKSLTQQFVKIADNAKKSGIASIVKNDLQEAQSAVTDVGNAFVSKAKSTKQQAKAKALIKRYLADLQAAANAYN